VSGELQLALAYELTAENAPRFAADIVAQAAGQGVVLDYSESTLEWLDSVTDSLRAGGVTVEQVPEVLFGFGCVLGQCIPRAAWVAASFVVPIGLRLADGTTVDPVGHAFATLAAGDRFVTFYKAHAEG
jgi:hypothetical protein